MNQKLLLGVLGIVSGIGSVSQVWAQAAYVAPAGALACADCHIGGTGSKQYVNGILEAFPIDQTLSVIEKIKAIHALTNEQRAPALAAIKIMLNPPATSVDTKPVIQRINTKWDITVGEDPLVIPFYVSDAENDAFEVKGTGMVQSPISIDPATKLPKFTLTWNTTASQAGQTYPINVFVKETQRSAGRILASDPVTARIKVWPARANAATAQISQLALIAAKWQGSSLKLDGQITFKSGITAAQKAAALANLRLNAASSQTGIVIGLPSALTIDAAGNWSQTLSSTQAPCSVTIDYEGLKAERKVVAAPANCVK
jgi:hypothetical protein